MFKHLISTNNLIRGFHFSYIKIISDKNLLRQDAERTKVKNMEHDKSFGEFLCEQRKKRRINSNKMADLIGKSPQYYCDFEKDRKIPTEELLRRILNVLRLPIEDERTLLDLAGKIKMKVSIDIAEYVMQNEAVRVALREEMDSKGKSEE